MRCTVFIVFCSINILAQGAVISKSREFELSIVHVNDFHARFEETDRFSLTCSNKSDECIGGFSRLYSAIQKLKEEYPDSIVLNAGDSFQGTLWYTIYRWKAVQYFMNKIPFDAHTLGNHEFDDGIAGLVPYLKNLSVPTTVANIDDSDEPTFQGLYNKSVIVDRHGLRIGIIGVITSNTAELSNSEKLKFLDESESVNREAEKLDKEEHVDTIIVLSHCGYEVDKHIAGNAVAKIGLIVGGHSHSLLYTGTPPGKFEAVGPYPTVVEHDDGRKILIVQASCYTKFLGRISLTYNSDGDVVSWFGAPIYLDRSVTQDPEMNIEIAKWKGTVDDHGSEVVGRTAVFLDGTSCKKAECNLGNFIADAMINSISDINNESSKKYSPIAFINPGGIRTSLPIGDITVSRLLECQPFHDTFDYAELQGKYIREALEHSAQRAGIEGGSRLLQVSGIRVVYNMTNAIGSRVESVKVLCKDCTVPKYDDIEMDRYYTIISNSFVMSGQEGYDVIPKNAINFKIGDVDTEVLIDFFQINNPVVQTVEGRITVLR